MYTKPYTHEFTARQSQSIGSWRFYNDELIALFGHTNRNMFFSKSYNDMRRELMKKDILIDDVQFCFSDSITTTFLMAVRVNASFMPECVDNICQDFFDEIIKEIKYYVDRS